MALDGAGLSLRANEHGWLSFEIRSSEDPTGFDEAGYAFLGRRRRWIHEPERASVALTVLASFALPISYAADLAIGGAIAGVCPFHEVLAEVLVKSGAWRSMPGWPGPPDYL